MKERRCVRCGKLFRTRRSKVECGSCALLIAQERGGEIMPRLGEFGPKQTAELAPLMKAEDLKQPQTFTVKAAIATNIKGKLRPRLTFEESDKEWIVNASNAAILAQMYGDIELGQLIGKKVRLASVPTTYQGKPVQGIRVQA
jgi:hypothetical protein